MSLEKDIISLLVAYRDFHCGGKSVRAAEDLGVTPPTFSRWIAGRHIPKVETLIMPFERLNARIILGRGTEVQDMEHRCRELEGELAKTEELLEKTENIVSVQADLIERLKGESEMLKKLFAEGAFKAIDPSAPPMLMERTKPFTRANNHVAKIIIIGNSMLKNSKLLGPIFSAIQRVKTIGFI